MRYLKTLDLLLLSACCMTLFLTGAGCPITPADTPDEDVLSDSGDDPDDGADTSSADGGEDSGDASGSRGYIYVQTLDSAANTYYDLYNRVTSQSLLTYNASNMPISVRPGAYFITQYFNADFLYAPEVVVTQGATTTVTLGGIQLVKVDGAVDGYFDIYDSTGNNCYSTYNEPDRIITAPAGTFTLKEYFNSSFTYAENVTVAEGATTTVTMGGIKLETVPGAADGTYAIYDETGTAVYATYNDPNVIVTAPAGTFMLKEYFNADFTYASSVTVNAGETTTVQMGAVRYNGTMAYDIYSGGAKVSSYNEAGLIITAPAGTYTLTQYFNPDNVLVGSLTVSAGAITDVY